MFNTYYRLIYEPFTQMYHPNFSRLGENQKAVIDRMEKVILSASQGGMLLFGDQGQGNQILIDILTNRIEKQINISRLELDGNEDRTTLPTSIAWSLYLETTTTSVTNIFTEITNHLIHLYKVSGKKRLLILENSHWITQEILHDLIRILSIAVDGHKIISILFVGNNKLPDIIDSSAEPDLKESIIFRHKTGNLSEQDTAEYISYHLIHAGCPTPLFSYGALTEIYRQTKGNMQSINGLCSNAIKLGTLRKQELIDAEIIHAALTSEPGKAYTAPTHSPSRTSITPGRKKGQRRLSSTGKHPIRYVLPVLCVLGLLVFMATRYKYNSIGHSPVDSSVADTAPKKTKPLQPSPAPTETPSIEEVKPIEIAPRNITMVTDTTGETGSPTISIIIPDTEAQTEPATIQVPALEEQTVFEDTPKSPELPPLLLQTLVLQAKPNTDTINDKAMMHLKEYTQALLQFPDTKVLIEGYIASNNDTAANTQLSQRRADHIRNEMIKLGATPDQLQTIGRGNHNPIASNNTAEGRRKNRRIEISIIDDSNDQTANLKHLNNNLIQ